MNKIAGKVFGNYLDIENNFFQKQATLQN